MPETANGLAGDAHPRSGDEFLRLDFCFRDDIDVGAMLGADPAPRPKRRELRNRLIAELLLRAWRDPERWTSYSRDRNAYAALRRYYGNAVTYTNLFWALRSLEVAGLIEHRKTNPHPDARWRSTIRATKRLINSAPATSVHDFRRIIIETIRLKNADGALTDYKETKNTRTWRKDVIAQNEALDALEISLDTPRWQADTRGFLSDGKQILNPAHNQMYRVYNGRWSLGGRWYGGWWQHVPFSDRQHLRLNGSATVELDFPFFHPDLIAALSGRDLGDADPYVIPGLPRNDVKRAFNILVNASCERSAELALRKELAERGRPAPGRYAHSLINAVKANLPAFSHAWGTCMGLKIQTIDSDICARVQKTMRDKGHVVLSVHDSFIVQKTAQALLEDVMEDVFSRTKFTLKKRAP